MIEIVDVEIVSFGTLLEKDQKDLKGYFEANGTDKIIDMENGTYCTYRQLMAGASAVDFRVAYGPDMFLAAIPFVAEFEYVIAVNENGEHMATLASKECTYIHAYKYSGGADLSVLDAYDCIFLHDCNEYSVELCQSVLKLWKGKRLVLVGVTWEQMIPMLPDLPGITCYYETELESERYAKLVQGCRYLHITYGLPCSESMERYEAGVMFYDEIMSFLFMYSDYQELGELNPDKNFFVLDAEYPGLGLFALFGKAEACARFAKSRGFVPVIRLKYSGDSIYANGEGDDIWSKFYCQPEGYSIDEVMHSKHVFFSPCFYNGSIQTTIMERIAGDTSLTWPDGIYNARIIAYINEKQKQFLPHPERTLGVLARGTDYANAKLSNHAMHASKELLGEKIDELWETWGGFDYIYMSTEDAGYCEYFKERYGEKIFFTDQERFRTKAGEMLWDMHEKEAVRRDGYRLGAEYILSINLLSKCKSLLASGDCWGVTEALKENEGRYENVFVFDLGVNR